jgi:RNA-directed DNA polymerase
VRSLLGTNAVAIIKKLNPIIRGWAAYYRHVVSTEVFASLDAYIWRLLWKWARRSHRAKSRMWVGHHYWDKFHPARNDRWVFGDRKSGAFLTKFAWTGIVRHVMVKSTSSPDDPALADYWAKRGKNRSTTAPMPKSDIVLAKRQQGRCPICNELLIPTNLETREGYSPEVLTVPVSEEGSRSGACGHPTTGR